MYIASKVSRHSGFHRRTDADDQTYILQGLKLIFRLYKLYRSRSFRLAMENSMSKSGRRIPVDTAC